MPRLVVNLRDSREIWRLPEWAVGEIRASAPAHLEVHVVDAEVDGRGDGGAVTPQALAAIEGAEIYLGFGFPRPLFEAARRAGAPLRWVHSGAAGVGGALYPEMRDSSIMLTNSAGVHGPPIADTVIGMIHHFARGLDLAVRGQRERRWAKDEFEAASAPVHEIAGTPLGLLGYGGIGRAIAARAAALGMRVRALRRRADAVEENVEVVHGEAGLQSLLRESQYIVAALPATAETRDLLDASRLRSLRPDAVLINVGRGDVVDEDALAELLRDGRIRGAALDVFRAEPLPPDSPFWELSNVLLTPHVSATSREFWRREVELIVENLARYERGDELRNLVDKRAGY
jgi:phosphoglycerate dehydrogenase-like enzyme